MEVNHMSRISEKVSYLEGLLDGLDINEEKTKKVFDAIIDTLHVIADEIAEHDICINELNDLMDDFIDLDDEDYDDDDFDDESDEFFEIVCPACGETIYFDEDMLDSEDGLICPYCNEPVDITIYTEDEAESEDDQD